MPFPRPLKLLVATVGVGVLALAVVKGPRYYKKNLAAPRSGEVVYREECLRCHGSMGQGVAGKSDEPLVGEKSIASLAKYVAKEMPEDDPGALSAAESLASAEFIHQAFYSPEARARNNPPRLELAHLTDRQYRESITDLLGSFRRGNATSESGGLAAVYRGLKDGDSTNTNKNEAKFLERVDPAINFDFGTKAPAAGARAEQFKIDWTGSLLVPDTGEYDFRVTTPNGVRVYVNAPSNGSEKNALIDLWVSSAMLRSGQGQAFLLGGRSYPFKVEFFKYKDKTASIKLEWRPPGGAWTVIPAENLSPKPSSSLAVVSIPLPPDDASMGYERGVSVSREWTEAVAKGALQAAAQLAPRLHEYAGTTPVAPDRAEKLKAFSLRFAQLAYRRPLEEAQKAELLKLFTPVVTPRGRDQARGPACAVFALFPLSGHRPAGRLRRRRPPRLGHVGFLARRNPSAGRRQGRAEDARVGARPGPAHAEGPPREGEAPRLPPPLAARRRRLGDRQGPARLPGLRSRRRHGPPHLLGPVFGERGLVGRLRLPPAAAQRRHPHERAAR